MALKKTLARKRGHVEREELSSEYRFDYRRSKPNRFAAAMSSGAIAVVLEPDVVNALLRSVISAVPQSKRKI
jgi:hypothetical protein